MTEDYVDFESARLMGLVRRHATLIGLAVLVGMGLGLVQSVMSGVQYTASAEVLVGQPITAAQLLNPAAPGVDQNRLVNYAQQSIQSQDTAKVVERRLGLLPNDYDVSVAGAASYNVLRIDATTDNADKAADIANAFATAYIESVKKANLEKVNRADQQIQASIDQVTQSAREIARAGGDSTAQLALLATYQGRKAQIDAARVIDPEGGAQVVDPATEGTQSLLGTALPVILGGLLGFLIGLAAAAFLDRGNRGSQGGRRMQGVPVQRESASSSLH